MENIKLADSGITLTDEHRYYDKKGKEFFGITSLINKHITRTDFSAIDPVILKMAIEYGNAVHSALEDLEKFGEASNPDVGVEVQNYVDLRSRENLNILRSEYIVTDGEKYASPIDQLGMKDGKLCIIDIKTTSTLNKTSVSWQLSIYKYFFEKMNPSLEIGGLYCLFFQDRDCDLVDLTDMEIPTSDIERLFAAEDVDIMYGDSVALENSFPTDKALSLITEIHGFLEDTKILKAEIDRRDALLREMLSDYPPFSINNDKFRITKMRDSVRVSIDTKRLRKDLPDVASKYERETAVKGGIRYALKAK